MQVFGSSKIFKRGLSVNSSFDISYISSSLDLSKTLSLRCLTKAVLSFRGGNNDRNGIYSSPTEVISNAISFVNPFHGAVAKNARASHTRWNNMC